MPKISPDATSENNDAFDKGMEVLGMTVPSSVIITGVGRKANTGNYENIDLFAGVTIPLGMVPDMNDLEAFKEAVAAACELGFLLASKETGARYNLIKEMQSGGRKEDPTPT